MIGVFEYNCDDGESVLLDNWQVCQSRDLDDPWEPVKVLFEGTKAEAIKFAAALVA